MWTDVSGTSSLLSTLISMNCRPSSLRRARVSASAGTWVHLILLCEPDAGAPSSDSLSVEGNGA